MLQRPITVHYLEFLEQQSPVPFPFRYLEGNEICKHDFKV